MGGMAGMGSDGAGARRGRRIDRIRRICRRPRGYALGPINTYVEPVIVPHAHVPVYTPYVPSGFGLPGAPRQEIGG